MLGLFLADSNAFRTEERTQRGETICPIWSGIQKYFVLRSFFYGFKISDTWHMFNMTHKGRLTKPHRYDDEGFEKRRAVTAE